MSEFQYQVLENSFRSWKTLMDENCRKFVYMRLGQMKINAMESEGGKENVYRS